MEDLLAEKDLTLEKTVTKCRAQEAAKRQRAEMAGTGGAAIQAIRRYQTPTYTDSKTPPTTRWARHAKDAVLAHIRVAVGSVRHSMPHATRATKSATSHGYVEDDEQSGGLSPQQGEFTRIHKSTNHRHRSTRLALSNRPPPLAFTCLL